MKKLSTLKVLLIASFSLVISSTWGIQNVSAEELNREQIYEWFEQRNWETKDEIFKKSACLFLIEDISEELQVKMPNVIFEELANKNTHGQTYLDSKTIHLNTEYLFSGSSMLNTCAHEVRHIWQKEQIDSGTELGKSFDTALNAYVSSDSNYNAYISNLIESDAWNYGNMIEQDFVANAISRSAGNAN